MKKRQSARELRSELGRSLLYSDRAELSEQIEQAVVTYEEALRMYDKCAKDLQALTARMERASLNMARLPKSVNEVNSFPGLRVDAANFSD